MEFFVQTPIWYFNVSHCIHHRAYLLFVWISSLILYLDFAQYAKCFHSKNGAKCKLFIEIPLQKYAFHFLKLAIKSVIFPCISRLQTKKSMIKKEKTVDFAVSAVSAVSLQSPLFVFISSVFKVIVRTVRLDFCSCPTYCEVV